MTSEQATAHRETPRASPTSTPAFTPLSKPEPWLSPQVSSYFIAGGIAGAASRTVVSPLERLKIIQCGPNWYPMFEGLIFLFLFCRQVQPRNTGKQYNGVWRSLVRMWKEEGFKGFMRGNGINCVRIIPYSAVQFTTYEQLKKVCAFTVAVIVVG
jgi:solute carrier family 25 (mitochondrial phosphate transporter), member 23/24/25/41